MKTRYMTPLLLATITVWSVFLAKNLTSQDVLGTYDIMTGEIVCSEQRVCLHEEGHKLDASYAEYWWRLDQYASSSTEFRKAVDQSPAYGHFYGIGMPRLPIYDVTTIDFWQGGWGGYNEYYAEVWAMAQGDINRVPPELKEFFQ